MIGSIEQEIEQLKQRVLDLEALVGHKSLTAITSVPPNATTSDIIFKLNELIKIINTHLR